MPLLLLRSINKAVHHLRAGNLVIYPTETAYALGADATNARAVRKVFKVKNRAKTKALPLIVASLAMTEKYAKFSLLAKKLAKQYWPGPLTIVLPAKKKMLPPQIIGRDHTVAVRVSSHKIVQTLTKRLGCPIVSTSANLSGQSNLYSPRTITKFFSHPPETIYFLSAGVLPRRKPSTIVASKNGKLVVLRRGATRVRGIRN